MSALLSLIPARAWAYIVGAVLVLMAAAGYVEHSKNTAAEQERQRIEKANTDARNKADAASQTVDGCYASGGRWDRPTGMCIPSPRP